MLHAVTEVVVLRTMPHLHHRALSVAAADAAAARKEAEVDPHRNAEDGCTAANCRRRVCKEGEEQEVGTTNSKMSAVSMREAYVPWDDHRGMPSPPTSSMPHCHY